MIMLGCRPPGRFTEQHDVFFGIGESLAALVPQIKAFWPESGDAIHIDVWREVTVVDNYIIQIIPKENIYTEGNQLFFLNLGGYKKNEFEEYHYKVLTVANDLAEATKKAKATSFYKHTGFQGAVSHIDDKYGVDTDDVYAVRDILNATLKEKFQIQITKSELPLAYDEFHIGYLTLNKLTSK